MKNLQRKRDGQSVAPAEPFNFMIATSGSYEEKKNNLQRSNVCDYENICRLSRKIDIFTWQSDNMEMTFLIVDLGYNAKCMNALLPLYSNGTDNGN